jgi:hypothetical protein
MGGALVLGSAALVVGLQVTSCLDVAEGSVVESAQYTAYADRLSHTPQQALLTSDLSGPGQSAPSAAALDSLPLQVEISDGSGGTYRLYLDRPIAKGMTLSDFAAAGGITLNQMPLVADDYIAALLKSEPDRAVAVTIGGHPGVLTWADPDENGVRPHHLYWRDDNFGHEIIAVRSAAAIINLARHLACAG